MSGENRDTSVAWSFHDATKYVWLGDESTGRWFGMGTPPDVEAPIWEKDWSLEPFPFKIYQSVPQVPIRRELPPSPLPALQAIARTGAEGANEAFADRATLARIGLLSNGLLGRQFKRRGTRAEFRTAGATGARYHLEVYFFCADLPDLPAGVYHYAAHDHSLGRLRAGDYRAALAAAAGGEPALAGAPVILAMTSTFWRNAWRYKARAYRHAFWDAGTAFANLLTVAAACGLPAKLVLGYADGPVNALLGVDGRDEAIVALCAIGHGDRPAQPSPDAPPLALPTRPVSPRQVEFPHIQKLHGASELSSSAEAASWRAKPLRRMLVEPTGEVVLLRPMPEEQLAKLSIEELIFSRRSTRHYAADVPIPFDAFSSLLDLSSRGVTADCVAPGTPSLHDLYLIVNNVDGLAPGVYVHHRHLQAVELLKEGDFRKMAQRLAVGQAYAAAAHVNCYYLTALGPVLDRYSCTSPPMRSGSEWSARPLSTTR
jgi:SagB-type dehydrogenase family enzyme